jgi:hypothetical protein
LHASIAGEDPDGVVPVDAPMALPAPDADEASEDVLDPGVWLSTELLGEQAKTRDAEEIAEMAKATTRGRVRMTRDTTAALITLILFSS